MRHLSTLLFILAISCGGSKPAPAEPLSGSAEPLPAPVPAAAPTPPQDAPQPALASGAVIEECEVYGREIQKLASCPKLPKESREALAQAYEQAKSAWKDIPEDSRQALSDACKTAAEAVRQASVACAQP